MTGLREPEPAGPVAKPWRAPMWAAGRWRDHVFAGDLAGGRRLDAILTVALLALATLVALISQSSGRRRC